MLGDDAQPATSDGYRVRAASGPRHAAPRKSLLTKLHVPAGKAVALAAMPTAVLMGMGFTPHLAQADELPKNPFKPGPCVTQSDTPSPTASGKDDGKDSSKDKATPKPTTSPSASAENKPDPTASPSAGDGPVQKLLPKSTATTAPAKPSPTPSPTKSVNPDPLGLGNLLGGLLGGGKNSDPTPSPTTASPTPHPSTTSPKPDASPKSSDSAGKTAGDAVKGTTDAVKKAAKALKDGTATPTPSASGTAASGASAGSAGKQPYPCPTYDAKALSDANVETGIPLVPDDPWTLKSSKLSLHGLNYEGIVQVKTYSGQIKDALKFTATGIDIGDLDQIVVGPNGGHAEVKAAPGSTSTIRNGTVTLYTESLSGNLLGLVPITFTPKAPPPLTLPELFFTNVTVIQAGQFGGDLTVPGMHVVADIG